jgi:CBS domain-containing protein
MEHQTILDEEEIAEERANEVVRLGDAIARQPIRSLASLKPPLCVPVTASVPEAIAKMTKHGIGCVLVTENDRLVGVFTERDVLRKLAGAGVDPASKQISEVMTRDPECLTLDDGIAFALNLMSVGGFRHIPLIDEKGRPTGVVAMRAIVDYMVDLFPREVLNLPPVPSLSTSREREGA